MKALSVLVTLISLSSIAYAGDGRSHFLCAEEIGICIPASDVERSPDFKYFKRDYTVSKSRTAWCRAEASGQIYCTRQKQHYDQSISYAYKWHGTVLPAVSTYCASRAQNMCFPLESHCRQYLRYSKARGRCKRKKNNLVTIVYNRKTRQYNDYTFSTRRGCEKITGWLKKEPLTYKIIESCINIQDL